MRVVALISTLFLTLSFAAAQKASSSAVYIVTVYSQNEQFYLKSIPHDANFPTLPGITHIFEKGSIDPTYTLQRGFDSVDEGSNNLVLSNDGQTVFYALPWGANEELSGFKSISIYTRGKLVREYSVSDITGCELSKERCELVYSNYNEVVDREKSRLGSPRYQKTFKSGVNEQEKFLSDYAILAYDDIVYITDSKRRVHRFSLSQAKYLDSRPFSEVYREIQEKGRSNKIALERFESPTFLDFPNLRSGAETNKALAQALNMKVYDHADKKDEKYKMYSLKISGFLKQDGSFELTDFDGSAELPKSNILSFFLQNKFDSSSIPTVFERWLVDDEYFFFRKADNNLALKERREELLRQREELKKRLVAETIAGRYVPKDLGDALQQLDKELPEITRKEMVALLKRDEMIEYHMGLGMWMRNNWGLWGGSRLQKYFTAKGIDHPDEMSSVILFYYWDWLKGNKDTWKEWDKNPKSAFDKK